MAAHDPKRDDTPSDADGDRLILADIARATHATADAITRLLAVARFGPTAGGGSGIPGLTGPTGGPGGGAGGGGAGGTPRESASARDAREWRERQQQIRERAGALQQVGMGLGGIGGRAHSIASRAEGLRSLGFERGANFLQANAGGLAIGGAALGGGMSLATGSARILHDQFATGDQQARAFARLLPGGETAQKAWDDLTGRAAKMERADVGGRYEAAEVAGRGRIAGFELGHNPAQARSEAMAAAFARGSAVVPRVFDTSTARGEVQRQDEMRLLPYRKESARTERELAAATAERVASQKELNKLSARHWEVFGKIQKTEKEIARGGSGPERQKVLREMENLLAEDKQLGELSIQARERLASSRKGEAGAKAARDTAKVREDMLGRADVLESQAQRSQGTAVRLGGMDPFQRQQGLMALKMLRDGANPDFMPPDLKAAAQSFAPQEFEKIAQRHGEGTAQFAEAQKLGLVGFEGKAADLQKEADSLRAEAGEKEYAIEGKAAKEVADAGRDLGKDVVRMVKDLINTAKMEVFNQILLGRNSS